MDFPPEQFPQITYQFERPGTPPGAGNGYAHSTKLIHDLREKRKLESPNPQEPKSPSSNIPYPVGDEATLELPAINPMEMVPTHVDVTRRNSTDFQLDEIQFRYGVQGYAAATFSLRFSESGEIAELVFDPYADGERFISKGSAEFEIRLIELKELLLACQNKPSSYRGVAFRGVKDRVAESSIEADHYNAATQAITAIDNGLQRPFGR